MMVNKIIVLVGESASGKTEVEKGLERIYGIQPLISHTSRPARVGEVHGVHYYFVDDKTIKDMINNGETIEHTTYEVNGEVWFYALARSEVDKGLQHKLSVVTINPRGIEQMLDDGEFNGNLVITYLKANESIRASRYFAREESVPKTLNNWGQRKVQDMIDFTHFENKMIKKIKRKGVEYVEIDNNVNYTDLEILIKIARDEIMRILGVEVLPFE